MKTLVIATLLSVSIGCFLGILRFVLDDKWKALPKNLCRFCLFFWVGFLMQWIVTGSMLYMGYPIVETIVSFITGASVATVVTSFSYVYIKNANL